MAHGLVSAAEIPYDPDQLEQYIGDAAGYGVARFPFYESLAVTAGGCLAIGTHDANSHSLL